MTTSQCLSPRERSSPVAIDRMVFDLVNTSLGNSCSQLHAFVICWRNCLFRQHPMGCLLFKLSEHGRCWGGRRRSRSWNKGRMWKIRQGWEVCHLRGKRWSLWLLQKWTGYLSPRTGMLLLYRRGIDKKISQGYLLCSDSVFSIYVQYKLLMSENGQNP